MAPPVNGDEGSMASTATSTSERAQMPDHRRCERALARSWGTGEAHGVGGAAERIRQPADRSGLVAATLDQRQQSGERGSIAPTGVVEQLLDR